MATLVQDFQCPGCGATAVQHHGKPAPRCTCEGRPLMQWARTRTYSPPAPRFGQAPAIDFAPSRNRDLPIQDAHGGQLRMESLSQVRRLERESEIAERNGEGQAMRFRAYAQDHGNMGENLFGPAPHKTPNLYRNGKQILSFEALPEGDADAPMGPGAEEALASALPDTPQE